jgi:hypothetical protein
MFIIINISVALVRSLAGSIVRFNAREGKVASRCRDDDLKTQSFRNADLLHSATLFVQETLSFYMYLAIM